jgi:hypothetical protein
MRRELGGAALGRLGRTRPFRVSVTAIQALRVLSPSVASPMRPSPSHRPATPDHLRMFLQAHLSEDRLHRIARADYGRDAGGIGREFKHNLQTGQYTYAGDGNPYECALLQRHTDADGLPLNELFGAWWIGAFCSGPDTFFLIDNLGVKTLLWMTIHACAHLGPRSSSAAHAALPFIAFLRARDAHPYAELYDKAVRALEAIERHGPGVTSTSRYTDFMSCPPGPWPC